jgi:hypothetical protein
MPPSEIGDSLFAERLRLLLAAGRFDEALTLAEQPLQNSGANTDCALASKNPMQTLPTFVIQGETLVGFSPYALEHAVRAALSPSEPETGLLAAKRDTAERAP